MSVNPHILIHPFLTPFRLVKHNFVFLIHACPSLGNKFMGINFQVTPISDVIGYLSFSFFLTSSWVIISGPSMVVQTALFHSFPWLIFHCEDGPLLLFAFFCWWTFWFLPSLGYGKCCCSAGLPACVFSILLCSVDPPVSGPARSHGSSIVTFNRTSILFSTLAVTGLHPTRS